MVDRQRLSDSARLLPVQHAGGQIELVELDQEHPGFRDQGYRRRRNAIAAVALAHRTGEPVPDVEYVPEEHAVWRTVWQSLSPLHEQHVVRELLEARERLALDVERIPQLAQLNPRLQAETGFSMEPVAGLVSARIFLTYLGMSVFLSTQYIRHASRPLYTPEPDVVHELIGHAASLTDPAVAALSRSFGDAARGASDTELRRLERVYWYTLEFGVALEADRPKAYGAGLLSSCGELQRITGAATLLDWDLDRMAATDYDPTNYQPELFLAPSFGSVLTDLSAWLESARWRDPCASS